ncbi:MAG: hypothetical protein H7099_14135 [Gemmatimonadaceae bacterium]|nr:hypothetical protein [Gemmatimonadaceae bacterium]
MFDSEAQATNVRDTRAARGEAWAIVPGRGEEPEVSSTAGQEPFFCILHGERSPMALEVYRDVDRRSIRSIELAVHSEDAGTARTVLVPLPELDIDGRPVGKPDALFFSVEALDKYLFPHLVSVYGVDGASAFRASVLESLRRSFPDPDYRVLV